MGQYYRPAVLKHTWKKNKKPVKASLLCYDYDVDGYLIGAKLMEHSYVGNPLVQDMEELIATKYKGYPFAWIGDYSDAVEINGENVDLYTEANKFMYKDYDSDSDAKSSRYLSLKRELNHEKHHYKYLFNKTKKQYCVIPKENKGKSVIHPLPLLTAYGNGRGGGDYGIDDERVGSWAFDKIGATDNPQDFAGFDEISGFFKLDW